MKVHKTTITDLFVIEGISHVDSRGSFSRLFCKNALSKIIGNRSILQINYSLTNSVGALRGMHFQRAPHAEMKLVRCLRGKVWDVAIDLRPSSPSYLRWHAEELTPASDRMLVIPEGFAHGFQVMEPDSELLYLHTSFYQPEFESGLRFDDPIFNIDWPLQVTDISKRDSNHPYISSSFNGVCI